jgi:NADPH:quinone reductase-like Zn-dependent oxidoreductase
VKAYEIRERFGLDHLVEVQRPEPEPGPYQVVVRVRAVSLNYRDLMMVRGQYNPRQPLPLVPFSDGAGVVEKVGALVTRFRAGDRVASVFAQRWISGQVNKELQASTLGGPLDGMLQELVCLHEEGLVPVPEHLSEVEAATLPCAGVTAFSALTQAQLKPGQTVLLQGTGGVSLFALQFAKLFGARVILTSSSDAKLEKARALGADETLNYKTTPEWGKRARELTRGEGVDLVVEVGGAGTFEQSLRAVRPGGQVAVIGVLSGGAAQVPLTALLMNAVRAQGTLVGSRETFEQMNRAVALHKLRPIVDKVFPMAHVREALEYLASGAHFGKVCCQ